MHAARWLTLFVSLTAQVLSQTPALQSSAPANPLPLPLSGRQSRAGSVATTQTTVNAGGANSVNLIDSRVGVQGAYGGSVPGAPRIGTVLPLTLDYAIKLGLQYNLGTVGFEQSVRSAQGQRAAVRSTLLPNVNGYLHETAQQTSLQALGVKFPGIPTVVGPFNYFDLRATLTQSVFDLTRLRNLHAATELVKSTALASKDARDLVVLAVSGNYLQVIAAAARVSSARAQLQTAQTIYKEAVDRNKAGLNAAIDALRSQVQLQTQQQRLRSLVADFDRQKLNLARIIGLPLDQDFTIANEIPYQPLEGITVQSALDEAGRNRSDLLSALSQVHAAEAARKAVSSARLPSLALYADYGDIGINPASSHGTFTVVGALNIPIFEGGRIRADEVQANAALAQRRAELEDLRGRVDYDVRTAFLDLQSAADQVGVAQSNVNLAQQTLQQSRDRFAAGVADTVEVVQAQEAVTTANNDYISAVYSHNLAKASLARATGLAEQRVRQYLQVK
ncbi:MAG: TolC family protein [Bryobacteraceae bacterium]